MTSALRHLWVHSILLRSFCIKKLLGFASLIFAIPFYTVKIVLYSNLYLIFLVARSMRKSFYLNTFYAESRYISVCVCVCVFVCVCVYLPSCNIQEKSDARTVPSPNLLLSSLLLKSSYFLHQIYSRLLCFYMGS